MLETTASEFAILMGLIAVVGFISVIVWRHL